jgi:CVNH domain
MRMDRVFATFFSAVFLGLALTSTSQAQSSCDSTANVPAGSYRQSCTQCRVSGGDLTASCKKIKSSYNSENTSTLPAFATCRSGIENFDGFLTCTKGDAPLPAGTYGSSCRNLNVERNTLYATCRNVNGDWKEANLSLGKCNYQIYNSDGVLACTLPYGTYQRSCQNARVINGQLYASCKNNDGAWVESSTPVTCSRDLNNRDGHLNCG